jgi:hypothetical protein
MKTDEVKMFENPYEKLKEAEKELDMLSNREKEIKSLSQKEQKLYRRELEENETKQLFLFVEIETYKNCINWLEIYKKGFDDGKEELKK